jgi:hypothetical protein
MRNPCGNYRGINNPCGKNRGVGSMNPISRKTGGKMTQVFGKKGETKKYIVG